MNGWLEKKFAIPAGSLKRGLFPWKWTSSLSDMTEMTDEWRERG
jgi:hypothetical protein